MDNFQFRTRENIFQQHHQQLKPPGDHILNMNTNKRNRDEKYETTALHETKKSKLMSLDDDDDNVDDEVEEVNDTPEEQHTYQAEKQRVLNTLKYQEYIEEDCQFSVGELREKSTALIEKTIEKSKTRKRKAEELKKSGRIQSDSQRIDNLEENIKLASTARSRQSSYEQPQRLDSQALSSVNINHDDDIDDNEFESVMDTQTESITNDEEDEFESTMDTQDLMDSEMFDSALTNEENESDDENRQKEQQSFIIETEIPGAEPLLNKHREQEIPDKPKSQRRQSTTSFKRKTKEERQIDLEVFKTYLLIFFAFNRRRNIMADSPIIQGLLYSMIPEHIITMALSNSGEQAKSDDNDERAGKGENRKGKGRAKKISPVKKKNHTTSDIVLVQTLVKWFQTTFEIDTPEVEEEEYRKIGIVQMHNLVYTTTEKELIQAIQERKLSDSFSFIVFLSMFRCLGISCRQVSVIDPHQYLKRLEWSKDGPNNTSQSKYKNTTTSRWYKKKKEKNEGSDKKEGQSSEDELKEYIKEQKKKKKRKSPSKSASQESEETFSLHHNDIWIEMYSSTQKCWIRIDHDLYEQKNLLQTVMNKFKFSQPNLNSSKDNITDMPNRVCEYPFFVVAFGKENSYIKDVTFNHCIAKPKDTISGHQQFEESYGWFRQILTNLSQLSAYDQLPSREQTLIEQEQERFKKISEILMTQLPKSQDAYKAHPLYCIEKWITRYEALYPPDPPSLGKCGKHDVYARSYIHTLHTKDRWIKEGRQVMDGEKPYKIVKASHLSSGANCELYGKWQTVEYVAPVAKDGIVPKNDRGQVDLWHERMLPTGTVHIHLRGIAQVARKLNIDYAPAMTGFEVRAKRSVPKIEGIVVCSEYEDILKDAYVQNQRIRLERLKKKKELRIRKNWRRLVLKLLAREDIQSRFGHLLKEEQEKEEERKKKRRKGSSTTASSTSSTSTSASILDGAEDLSDDDEDDFEDYYDNDDDTGRISHSSLQSSSQQTDGLKSINGVVVEFEQLM